MHIKTSIWQRFLREPLLHFILIGGLFFLLYAGVNDASDNQTDIIRITPQRIAQLVAGYNAVWNRSPSDEELDHLINEDVRSEVYYRDALALGLDKNDSVVRRRLRQKMEFLTDTGTYLIKPASAELEVFFAAHKQKYKTRPRLAFEQVYLGADPTEEVISKTLKTLLAEPASETTSLGQRSVLPAQLKLTQPDAVDSVFGKGFYAQIADLAPGGWAGPVTSVYGVHLVRTLDGVPARTPQLEEVREVVLRDWKSAQAKKHREQDYTQRRSQYTVEIRRADQGGS